MRRIMISLMPEMFLLSTLLLPSVYSAQVTPALGRLHITSMPAGANIVINDNRRPELTNVTLVVSPGKYAVLVTGGPGKLNCSKTVQVSRGQTVDVACP